jgi:hypothetical protein
MAARRDSSRLEGLAEYGHAVRAVLVAVALVALTASVLKDAPQAAV